MITISYTKGIAIVRNMFRNVEFHNFDRKTVESIILITKIVK